MSKETSSKKKRNSTGNKKTTDMPKTARIPAKEGQTPKEATKEADQASSIEAMLAGMESRLASKIDSTNSKVEKALDLVAETNTALDDLEMRVIATEKKLEERLVEAESRLEKKMNTHIKALVLDQLREAGFDPDLTAGALSMVAMSKTGGDVSSVSNTYAAALNKNPGLQVTVVKERKGTSQQERQEERFWECRRSLRLWPVKDRGDLVAYLKDRLDMDKEFVDDMGEVGIRRVIERRPRYKDEAIVTFEDKRIRDAVKAQAYKLSNSGDRVGMRLHLPDHLQKSFRALMGLSFDMKKKFPGLRRSVKFSEDTMDLYMDIQTSSNADWRRIDSEQAVKAAARRPGRRDSNRTTLMAEDIEGLLGGEDMDE